MFDVMGYISTGSVPCQGVERTAEVTTMQQGRWLSVEEIATHLGIKRETVYMWIETKKMPAHKMGRLWKFQQAEVDEWVRTGGAAPAPMAKENE